MTRKPFAILRSALPLLLRFAAPLAVLLWANWTSLEESAQRWATDAQYSHGYLVPVFALVLLWLRRHKLDTASLVPSWWGAPVLAASIALRLFGAYYQYTWLDAISLLPCLAGVCLLTGGWSAWRWSWPAVAFLFFMIPLPYRLAVVMSGPLQQLATLASTFTLQTLGLPAVAEGNLILLNDTDLDIAGACSGLRMLVIFFALSTGVALVIRRSPWEKLWIVISAIPIALLANVVRITTTGILFQTVGGHAAKTFFHDLAGWLMMPLALALLALELKLIALLWLERPRRDKSSPGRPRKRLKWSTT